MVGRRKPTDTSPLVQTDAFNNVQQSNSTEGKENNNYENKEETLEGKKEEFKTKTKSILEEFDIEFQAKLRAMQELAESYEVSLRNCLTVQLVKIPKRIREMKIEEFRQNYGEDISAVLVTEIESEVKTQLQSRVKKRKKQEYVDPKEKEHKARRPPLPPTAAKPPVPSTAIKTATNDEETAEGEYLDTWASTPASAVIRRRRKQVADILTTQVKKVNEETKKRFQVFETPKTVKRNERKANIKGNDKTTEDTEHEHKSISKLLQEMRATHSFGTPSASIPPPTVSKDTGRLHTMEDTPFRIELQNGAKIDLSTPHTLKRIKGPTRDEAKMKLNMLHERVLECLRELDDEGNH
eukprot:jgi/Galph1/1919/GphlegSOOS_G591.1